jgi:hypothetical protein
MSGKTLQQESEAIVLSGLAEAARRRTCLSP